MKEERNTRESRPARPDRNRRSAARRGRQSRGRKPAKKSALLTVSWIFLGAVLVLAAAAVILLLPKKTAAPAEAPLPTVAPGPAGSAFVTGQTAPPVNTEEGRGGRSVTVLGIRCEYTEPENLTMGILRSVDLSALGEELAANVAAEGWGQTTWSVDDSGALLLRAKDPAVLTADGFEKQAAFLKTGQPENLSRTFVEHSGLIPMLREYGLTLGTQVENNDGEIVFRGAGDAPGSSCSARLTFLYNGSFNQAVIRAVYLDGAVTTDEVMPLSRAVKNALTWDGGADEGVYVTGVELRSVRGLPFYAMDCDSGATVYALAVSETALPAVPGAEELYSAILAEGIREYVVTSGGE
ncbi:MAG: hypothetical protein IJT62_00250 [Oscillospiraceae bacterium]|nr:hypothetical protein [Oscillospiraceae bacterium]